MAKPELLGVKEVAQLLGIDRATVASWKHQGRLPAEDYNLSGNPIWFKEHIVLWVNSNDYIKARVNNVPEMAVRNA